jgi:hypothetical protein
MRGGLRVGAKHVKAYKWHVLGRAKSYGRVRNSRTYI